MEMFCKKMIFSAKTDVNWPKVFDSVKSITRTRTLAPTPHLITFYQILLTLMDFSKTFFKSHRMGNSKKIIFSQKKESNELLETLQVIIKIWALSSYVSTNYSQTNILSIYGFLPRHQSNLIVRSILFAKIK